ncbi:hypothetical protein, partial [Ligaoa zhengdingensis]
MKRKIWSVLLAAAMLFNLATPVLALDGGPDVPVEPAVLSDQLPEAGEGEKPLLPGASADDALILSYDFNEADGGVIPDRSGNGNDATVNGAVEIKNGLAILDGGYIELPALDLSELDGMTVTGWTNRDELAN